MQRVTLLLDYEQFSYWDELYWDDEYWWLGGYKFTVDTIKDNPNLFLMEEYQEVSNEKTGESWDFTRDWFGWFEDDLSPY